MTARTIVATWPVAGKSASASVRAVRELVAAARGIAADGPVTVAVLGTGQAEATELLRGIGPCEAVAFEGDATPDGFLAALGTLIDDTTGTVVLPGDLYGHEIAGRLAPRTGGVAINDVIGVEPGYPPAWRRAVFGGKATARLSPRKRPCLVTVRSRAFAPVEGASDDAPSIAIFALPAVGSPIHAEGAVEDEQADTGLEEARVIVSGGRGLGSAERFAQLHALAEALGGRVGASLGAVDEGWARQDMQIGLTGKVVGPDVYLAVGISGASQHLAGLAGVKYLVAINSDPEAPIFRAAQLGVVADCTVLLPLLIEELHRSRAS